LELRENFSEGWNAEPMKIIAEIGSVHDGSFDAAVRLIEAAADCGADTVKFQVHIPEVESLADAPNPPHFTDETRMEYFQRTAFTPEQWATLKVAAEDSGLVFLASCFSQEALDLLEKIGVSAHKVPSGEVTNLPLLEKIVATGKPVYLSSGMSNWKELDAAVNILGKGGPLTIMQCSSLYPCPPERAGLNVIGELWKRYSHPVGFSDHSDGIGIAVAAAASGATVIEKHFTLSRTMYGSDAPYATEPKFFAEMCAELHRVWVALGNQVDKDDLGPYREMKRVFEKSVCTTKPILAGATLTVRDLACKKPGDGISAARFTEVVGRTIKHDLPADHKLNEEDLV